jgi:membrane protease YdiL (CAAX protease family)
MQMPLSGPEELSREEPPSPARPDPDNPPWGIWGALVLLGASFLLMIVVQTTLVVAYALHRGVPLAVEAIADFTVKDARAIVIALVSLVLAHVLTLVVAWLLVTRAGRFPFLRTLGWEWRGGLTFWRSVGLAVGLWVVGFVILSYTGTPDNELERILRSSREAALITAFAATFTAPLVEEIVFRGMLYSALRRVAGAGWAVSVVFVLFALIHVPQYWPSYGVIVTILVLSFVLTMVRARTGRLLPCVVIHTVFNGIQSLGIVFAPYIERLYPEQAAPAPGLLVELLLRLHGSAW